MDKDKILVNTDGAVELTELFTVPEKSYNLSDIITFQAIVSVVVSVVFVVINTFYPSIATEIYDEAVSVYNSVFVSVDTIERITEFFNSSPSDYLNNDKV